MQCKILVVGIEIKKQGKQGQAKDIKFCEFY